MMTWRTAAGAEETTIFRAGSDTYDGIGATIRVEGRGLLVGSPLVVEQFPNDEWTAWYPSDSFRVPIVIRAFMQDPERAQRAFGELSKLLPPGETHL